MYDVKASERASGFQFGDMLMDRLAVTAVAPWPS